MKRLFWFLCLITTCSVSYANIASVGYVDGVVANKQNKLTAGDGITIDGGTISAQSAVYNTGTTTTAGITKLYTDTGSATDGTMTQGAIVSALANKQDKLPMATRPTDGAYDVVYSANAGQFIFKSDALQCSTGTYDIGFDQCIDVSQIGTASGYIRHTGSSSKAADYGLTEKGTWGTTLYTGDKVTGIASCNSTPGSTRGETTTEEFSQTSTGQYCWCKMTAPSASRWVFDYAYASAANCADSCAGSCAGYVQYDSDFRSGVFGSVVTPGQQSDTPQCESGTYDIGFDQCADSTINGSAKGIHDLDGWTQNATTYNLTTPGSWAVEFSYGTVTGIASCNNFKPTAGQYTTSNMSFEQSVTGNECWCKITSPSESKWVYRATESNCKGMCAYNCANRIYDTATLRSALYDAVGD